MKKNLLLAIATFSMLASTIAEARSVKAFTLNAQLKKMHIDPNSYLAKERFRAGSIVVDQFTKTITLQLDRKWYCPPGALCSMVMPAPIIIKLPLVSVTNGACNSLIFEARRDQRPVDGNLTVLSVVDNSRFNCPSLHPVEPTEVHLETVSAGMDGHVVKTHSSFTAEKLRPTSF
ncbi:MAG: hypothetical protein A4S09_16965 [Proteobacteria bacterium SG_bin7]|nr:MAG: hypothetical protein A4S09_16965 [Proteobacteria bacterium SG_bin7]